MIKVLARLAALEDPGEHCSFFLDIGWQLLASFTGRIELPSLLPAPVYLCLLPVLLLIRNLSLDFKLLWKA